MDNSKYVAYLMVPYGLWYRWYRMVVLAPNPFVSLDNSLVLMVTA